MIRKHGTAARWGRETWQCWSVEAVYGPRKGGGAEGNVRVGGQKGSLEECRMDDLSKPIPNAREHPSTKDEKLGSFKSKLKSTLCCRERFSPMVEAPDGDLDRLRKALLRHV